MSATKLPSSEVSSHPAQSVLAEYRAIYIAISLFFMALVAYQIYASYLTAFDAAVTHAKNMSLVIESKLAADFDASELAVTDIAKEIDPEAMLLKK